MLEIVEKIFSTRDLYEILAISCQDANDAEKLRNAYLRAALCYHPDKAQHEENAIQKFQLVSNIYKLLKDEDMKRAYDQTGEWPSDKFDIDMTSADVRKDLNAVEQFKKEYQGSETEREDIKKCYEENQGSFIKIFETVSFINVIDDLDRVTKIIDDAIEAAEIKRADLPNGYTYRWKMYLIKCQLEAKVEGGKDKDNSSTDVSSVQERILQQREESWTGFLERMEDKYGDNGPQDKKRRKTSKK